MNVYLIREAELWFLIVAYYGSVVRMRGVQYFMTIVNSAMRTIEDKVVTNPALHTTQRKQKKETLVGEVVSRLCKQRGSGDRKVLLQTS